MFAEEQYVESSNLLSASYDAEEMKLRITFKNGSQYEYEGVPEEDFIGLLSAESKGKFFYQNIRRGGYAFQKIQS